MLLPRVIRTRPLGHGLKVVGRLRQFTLIIERCLTLSGLM